MNDRKKKKSSSKTVGPAIRTCDECFAIIPAQCITCPVCGAKLKITEKKVEVDKKAELQEVTDFKLEVNNLLTKKPSELKTIGELKVYAKAKGYKPGWLYFQQRQRGWIK